MAGTSPVTSVGAGSSAVQFEAQRQVAVLRLQKEALDVSQSAALQLIEAAIAEPGVGVNLDLMT